MKRFSAIVKASFIGGCILVFGSMMLSTWADGHSSNSQPKAVAQKVVKQPITSDGLYLEINKVRATNHLEQFKRNQLLDKSAGLKCADMVAYHYYDHVRATKTGYSYIQDVGQKANYVDENLNKVKNSDSKDVVDSWMSSEAHRASILDPRYTEIGFAVCVDPKDPTYTLVVQHKIEPYVAPKVQYVPQQTYAAPSSGYTHCTTTAPDTFSNTYSTNCNSY